MKPYLIKARAVYEPNGYGGATGLLVREGKIARVGDYATLKQTYPDLPTREYGYVLPALVNTHVHLEFDATARARLNYLADTPELRVLGAAQRAREALQSGVATLRDAGSDWALLNLKDPRAQMLCSLPRLQMAGPPLTVTGGHLHFLGEETDTAADMVRQTRLRQKRGCDAVKLIVTGGQMTPGSVAERVSLTTEEIRAVVEEAHLLNVPTFAHCLTTEGFVRCMDGGVDCIEHIACFIRNRENGLLERMYCPETMSRYTGRKRWFMMGLSAGYHNLDDFRSGKRPCGANETFWLEQEERMFAIFRRVTELGLLPVCGTDAGTGGTRVDETWLELALMVRRGGLSEKEAIHIGTLQSAACLGLENQTGAIREGLSADLMTLEEDPFTHIEALAHPAQVICRGELV